MISRISTRVLIKNEDNKYLVIWIEKSDGRIVADIPGGGLCITESIIECAKREVFEETGLLIKNVSFLEYAQCTIDKPSKSYATRYKDPVDILCVLMTAEIESNIQSSVTLEKEEDIVYATWVDVDTLKELIPYLNKL